MIQDRGARAVPGSRLRLAFIAAALVVSASGFALGASMAIGIH